jgi:succinate dehydrogenase membrane anchor subunit
MKPVRPNSSARTGLTEWLWQRVSALYIGAFGIYVVVALACRPGLDFTGWKLWFASGAVRVAWAVFFLSLLVHAWIGMRSVFLDYAKPFSVRFIVSVLTALGLAALGVWAAGILIGVTS